MRYGILIDCLHAEILAKSIEIHYETTNRPYTVYYTPADNKLRQF